MRNWNIFQVCFPDMMVQYCEPTYEELKQVSELDDLDEITELRAYLWGIETQTDAGYNVFAWRHCEPTYEELKLPL